MKKLVGYAAVVLATLAGLVLLWQFRAILVLFMLSLFAAAVFRPFITRLIAAGVPSTVAHLLIYASAILGLGLGLYLIGETVIDEAQMLSERLALTYEITYGGWQNGTSLQQTLATRLPPPVSLYEAVAGADGELPLQSFFGVTQSVVQVVGALAIVLVLSLYWSIDQGRFERLWLSLLPAEQRMQARNIWRAIESAVGSYLRSEFLQSFMAAVLLGTGYWIMGLSYPLLLALLGAVAWLIPLAGVFFIAVPAFLAGLAINWGLAIAAVVYTGVVLLLLELVVEPTLYNRRRYSSLLIILIMIPLADAFGLAGLILAPPLAAAAQVLLHYLFEYYVHSGNTAVQIDLLEERYQELHTAFTDEESSPPELTNILQRLANLIEKTKTTLPSI